MYYEINFYRDLTNIPLPIKEFLEKTIQNKRVSLKKGWEYGEHITLFGNLDLKNAESIVKELSKLNLKYPGYHYSKEVYKKKYQPIASFMGKSESLEDIHQNKIYINPSSMEIHFNNEKQFKLYLSIHQIFDNHYKWAYFTNKIQIEDIIKDLQPFVEFLPETMLNDEKNLISNGYISHISHYIGLLNSLKNTDKEKIQRNFEERLIHFNNRNHESKNPLLNPLKPIISKIEEYVNSKEIIFIDNSKLKEMNKNKLSPNHAVIYENQNLLDLIQRDTVINVNKWVLNVLYEKLLLLNIKPLDKFFMNYVFSTQKVNLKEWVK